MRKGGAVEREHPDGECDDGGRPRRRQISEWSEDDSCEPILMTCDRNTIRRPQTPPAVSMSSPRRWSSSRRPFAFWPTMMRVSVRGFRAHLLSDGAWSVIRPPDSAESWRSDRWAINRPEVSKSFREAMPTGTTRLRLFLTSQYPTKFTVPRLLVGS
jgi:hypothetical protein